MTSDPQEGLDEFGRENGGSARDLGDVPELGAVSRLQFYDEALDAPAAEGNAHLAADNDAIGQRLWDRIPETVVDGMTRDVGNDPSGVDRFGQSDAAAAARSAEASVDSQGNWGRPKCPYAAVCR